MNLRLGLLAWITVIIGCVTPSVYAQTFSGSVSYTLNSSTVILTADEVDNNQPSTTTGTLQLDLYATNSPFNGGTLDGYLLGTDTLGVLQPETAFTNINATVPLTSPPTGAYYTTMTLEEYVSPDFEIDDYSNFSGRQFFGAEGDTSPGDAEMTGAISYTIVGSQITFNLEQVSSNLNNATTGTLQVSLWATAVPLSEATQAQVYVLGSATLGTLGPNQFFSSLSDVATLTPPPTGQYYITMVLEEYNGSFSPVDYFAFDAKQQFTSGGSTHSHASKMSGATKVSFAGSYANIAYGKISPAGAWATGKLRLVLVASAKLVKAGQGNMFPVAGTSTFPYLATINLPALKKGQTLPAATTNVKWKRPKAGKYYLYLVLMQDYSGSGWAVDDFRQIPGLKKF
jgi:hypothetical protein